MSTYNVENPTSRTKAVLVAGGHVVIKPGDKAKVDADWTDDQKAGYESAGLKITEPKATKADDK